jgi:hypothetical protein
MTYQYNYPSRNQARAILYGLIKKYSELNQVRKYDLNIEELTKNLILIFNHYGRFESNFEFTNALVDMFSNMNAASENRINTFILMNWDPIDTAEKYFNSKFDNKTLDSLLLELSEWSLRYRTINIDKNNAMELDMSWFNNYENATHWLISKYKQIKTTKEMLFLEQDIRQIIVDYTLWICRAHCRYFGFINEQIIKTIVNNLVEENNDNLNGTRINPEKIEFVVFQDLIHPERIQIAYDFLRYGLKFDV